MSVDDEQAGADSIPPIDPSIGGRLASNPDEAWTPPWLAQTPAAAPPQASAEVQMPDDYVGKPLVPSQPGLVPDVHPDSIPQQAPPWLAQAQHDANAPKLGATDYALAQELGAPTSTGEDPAKALNQIATDPNAPISDRQTAWQQMSPADRANFVNTADPKQLASLATAAMSPEEVATIALRHQQAQIHEQSAQQLGAMIANHEAQQRNVATYQQAIQTANVQTQQVAADAQRIAAMSKKNPNEHGVGYMLASVLLSTIGGAMSQYTGGKNVALDQLNLKTQQRIDAQTADIANQWKGNGAKQNLVAETLKTSGDLYHAQEAYRISQYDTATQELQTQMQDFDPNGTTAIRHAQVIQQIQAQRGAALAATNQQFIKNHLEQAKADNEANTLKATVKHQTDETAIARGHLGIDYSKNARDQKEFEIENAPVTPEQARLENPGLPDAAYPQAVVTRKDLKNRLESFSKGLEVQGKAQSNKAAAAKGQVAAPIQVGTAPDGTPVTKTTVLTQKDGTPWAAPEKFSEMAAGAKKVARLSDALTREISEWGGQSDIKKSPHYQTIKSNYEDLVFALHEAKGIEGFRPGTAELLTKLTGEVDPTSFFRDATTGIKQAKQNVTDDVNDSATTALYNGPRIVFNDLSAPPAQVETPADKQDKVLTQNFGASDVDERALDADNRAFTIAARKGVTTAPSANRADYAEAQGLSPLATRALDNGVAPIQLQAFDDLEGDIKGSDDVARAKAVERLEQVRKGSKSSAVRAYAKGLIEEASSTVLENTPLDVEGKR